MVGPPAPDAVRTRPPALRYRDHIGVNLLVERRPFPDNWIYVHRRRGARAHRQLSKLLAGHGGEGTLEPAHRRIFRLPRGRAQQRSDAAMTARR